ncbi:MAG: YhdH/YhfP family quinone oxidoreductase [Deltaproteobacteria bacterium]|jgi:acrylyl-CoA reductase (NADPH)|nr:YhdH/YhfP family quinone oxidoreductase [Deltaproteobacteria bacterium]
MSSPISFQAIRIFEEDGKFEQRIVERSTGDLPEGEVLIQVHYSSLNYKDALSASGNRGVTRNYPHTPGVDASGIVAASTDPDFKAGASVIVTSYDLGMNTDGGFGEYIRVPATWVLPLPEGLTLQEAMIYGTAGFTAAQSFWELQTAGCKPENGPVLVTGAAGGVGSIAVRLLLKGGYEVAAVSGHDTGKSLLKELGVQQILDRKDAVDDGNRPLLKTQWNGVIDNVGGLPLSTALKTTKPGGVITTCGNVAGAELSTTVFPFILRGLRLIGIDSQNCPYDLRKKLWGLLATDWKLPNQNAGLKEVSMEEMMNEIVLILRSEVKGRVVLRHMAAG